MDAQKEALFNILGGEVVGADVADLFAGSGSLGIEALSRGAESVVFVEEDEAAVWAINDNLETLGFSDRAIVKKASVVSFLQRTADRAAGFDLIFLDPPFRISVIDIQTIFEVLLSGTILRPSGLVVLRVFAKRDMVDIPGFELEKDRSYGDSRILLYRRMT